MRHDLWILADEVYEDYGYDAAHVSIATMPGAAERTVTVFSFAKSYAQAGLRVGYALGPDPAIAAMRKLVNHSVYNVPVAMQRAALGALRAGAPFLAEARRTLSPSPAIAPGSGWSPRRRCPPGGAYLWVDFRRWTGDDCMPVLERCAAAGRAARAGQRVRRGVRGLGAAVLHGGPADRLDEGIDRINAVLGRW